MRWGAHCVAVTLAACGPGEAQPEGALGTDDGTASSSATAAASSDDHLADDGTDTQPEPPETTGGALECTIEHGELVWSRREVIDSIPPRGVVLDPSGSGAAYLNYSTGTCVTRLSASGDALGHVDAEGSCMHLAIDSDGDFLVAGQVRHYDGPDDPQGDTMGRAARLDPDGVARWVVDWDLDTTGAAHGVARAPGGDLVVAGTYPDENDWVVRFDREGVQRWALELPGGGLALPLSTMQLGVDDTGRAIVADTVEGGAGDRIVRLHGLEADGTRAWMLDIDGPSSRLNAMAVHASGHAIVSWSTLDDGVVVHSVGHLGRVEADGTRSWTRTTDDTAIESVEAIGFGPCDTIVVAGSGDPDPDVHGSQNQIWIARLDAEGEPVWSEMIDGPYHQDGWDGDDRIDAIAVGEAGEVVALGRMTVAVDFERERRGSAVLHDLWLARFDL